MDLTGTKLGLRLDPGPFALSDPSTHKAREGKKLFRRRC